MPAIIDYPEVLARLTAAGFRCLYHNSGAFGFGGLGFGAAGVGASGVGASDFSASGFGAAGSGGDDEPRIARPHIVGWIGPDDPTIRHEMMRHVHRVPPPHEQNLARRFVQTWQTELSGELWIMPASHWSYELEFGSADWLADALRQIAIEPASLRHRNNGAAIEFCDDESASARQFVQLLLEHLRGSDFTAAFPAAPPPRRTLCTVHHHKQLWWQTTDDALAARLTPPSDDAQL